MAEIDCLLVYPKPTNDSPLQEVALSIFSLGAYLEERGLNIEYVDERFDNENRVRELSKNALTIAVSAMTGYQLIESKRILIQAREDNPEIITIFGGVHATLLPEQCIKQDFVDYVIMREGEETLYELITELKSTNKIINNIKGLVFKSIDGQIIKTSPRPFMNTDNIPFPMTAKSKRYFEISAKVGDLSYTTSRGCPNNCNFCYNQVFNQRKWRPYSIEKIEREIERFKKELDFDSMFLVDDNLGADKERMKDICFIMKKHNIKWHVNIRCNYINDDTALILEDGGCESLLLGVESGSDRVLNEVIGKDYPEGVEDIKRCARALGKRNIKSIYSFMCNIPTETKREARTSMKLADYIKYVDKNARISFYVYAAYPGTELYKMLVKDGMKEPQTFEEWSKVTLSESDCKAENLYYISGLTFRGGKGDRTDQNFPGIKRLKILPFEILCKIRWKLRFFSLFALEKFIIKYLIQKASQKVRK